jgi:internalin A
MRSMPGGYQVKELMQPPFSKWRKTVVGMAALAMAMCGRPGFSLEPLGQKDQPKPLPNETVEAWKDAGAEVGWMRVDKFGSLKLLPEKEGVAGDLPAFGFSAWKSGLVPKLPAPAAAFGLNLLGSKVRDVGLKDLAGLKNLQALNLRFNEVSDAGLKELAALKNLHTLNLGFTYVSDAGLKELAALKNLEALELFRTQVTAAGLKELTGLKKLQTLDVGGTRVTDPGLKELAGLKSLRALNLNSTAVTDSGLKELAGLKKLQTLDLRGTQVTDAALKELAGLQSLQALDLRFTRVTDAGLKELQKALPDCKISLKAKPLDLEIPSPPKKDKELR